MMRTNFDEQLDTLNREMITMGLMCEDAISKTVYSLVNSDYKLAETVPQLLEKITEGEKNIENICFKLLLQQQPVAKDLRTVSSALKMVTDLQRIGTQSADIAEIILTRKVVNGRELKEMKGMTEAVINMVTESIDAFVKKDEDLAFEVIKSDDVVDEYFNKIKAILVSELKEPDADGENVLDLLMITKYLERIGDHAENIARWVLFSITGKHYTKGDRI
ncbi:MAG: phosphate signaling complex protein PhoU [Oscillospiraceae bacterium]|jgi:phosphate transport system protein